MNEWYNDNKNHIMYEIENIQWCYIEYPDYWFLYQLMASNTPTSIK